ncbi:SIR2 family protein [Dactylosporangium vinaceum]|uniref:SIR2 family protein n=1 Tax=Dactylosporangium vinaceum TaxID=53362 RepID=A0ABV5LYZ7_9ACTN|nr:SIR2 family protein [Dactylosporangium vinaceum]UAB95191.1 SIR2 family protein [Dactylosporangium vinaceum]
MPISVRDLLDQYGEAALSGNASLFVGAGLSQDAGYPGWGSLLAEARLKGDIPDDVTDLPLVAQYYVSGVPGGRDTLDDEIRSQMTTRPYLPTLGHKSLAALPIDDIWTTNYDTLLEEVMPEARVIATESDLQLRRIPARRRITKMHGSFSVSNPKTWLARPVITRSDYESYEQKHPRMWSSLRATYLTRTFLFLGFSFTDPNVDILLRLARSMATTASEHFTVLRKPSATTDERLHALKVRDLEASGVAVCEISNYSELTPLMEQLVRRTRPPLLFIAGSGAGHLDSVKALGKTIGHMLADLDDPIELASFGGAAGIAVSFPFAYTLRAIGKYNPSRIGFHFRESHSPPPPLPERAGTAVYASKEVDELRAELFPNCRAMLVLGGGTTTKTEVETAQKLQLPIIPLPGSEGTARRIYETSTIEDLLGGGVSDADRRDWKFLANPEFGVSAHAAVRLVRRAMYLAGR